MDAKSAWKKRADNAKKDLGDGAEIPDLPGNFIKALDEVEKSGATFMKACEGLQDQLLDLDNAMSTVRNTLEQFKAKIEKANFGMDVKKDAKAIDAARSKLVEYLDENIELYGKYDKKIDLMNRQLVDLSKIKLE